MFDYTVIQDVMLASRDILVALRLHESEEWLWQFVTLIFRELGLVGSVVACAGAADNLHQAEGRSITMFLALAIIRTTSDKAGILRLAFKNRIYTHVV